MGKARCYMHLLHMSGECGSSAPCEANTAQARVGLGLANSVICVGCVVSMLCVVHRFCTLSLQAACFGEGSKPARCWLHSWLSSQSILCGWCIGYTDNVNDNRQGRAALVVWFEECASGRVECKGRKVHLQKSTFDLKPALTGRSANEGSWKQRSSFG